MDTLGRHVIAELDGCDTKILSDSHTIRRLLLEAVRKAGGVDSRKVSCCDRLFLL
jgi:S-adenosylmethionine/arginine decarboxylase-like enzyme